MSVTLTLGSPISQFSTRTPSSSALCAQHQRTPASYPDLRPLRLTKPPLTILTRRGGASPNSRPFITTTTLIIIIIIIKQEAINN